MEPAEVKRETTEAKREPVVGLHAKDLQLGKYTAGNTEALRVPVADCSLGILALGAAQSGKTHLMKKLLEQVTAVETMSQVIVLDVKGDYVTLLDPHEDCAVSPAASRETELFERHCDVRVYTFGLEVGWKATLNPLPVPLPADFWPPSGELQKERVRCFVRRLSRYLLISAGIVHCEEEALVLSVEVPSLRALGKAQRMKQARIRGPTIVDAAERVLLWSLEHTGGFPLDYEDFASKLQNPDILTAVNPDPDILDNIEDVQYISRKITSFTSSSRISWLFRQPKGDTRNPCLDDVYSLSWGILFGDRRQEQKARVSIVSLANLADDKDALCCAARSILCIADHFVRCGGGTQEAPHTAIILDEAHEVIPRGPSEGTAGLLSRLLASRRELGLIVALATQHPVLVDDKVLGLFNGPRWFGRIGPGKPAKKLLDKVLKQPGCSGGEQGRKCRAAMSMLQCLGPHELMYVCGHAPPRTVKIGSLCRDHREAGVDTVADPTGPVARKVGEAHRHWLQSTDHARMGDLCVHPSFWEVASRTPKHLGFF